MNAELNENFEYRVPTFDNVKVELRYDQKKAIIDFAKNGKTFINNFYCPVTETMIRLNFSKELLFNVAQVK